MMRSAAVVGWTVLLCCSVMVPFALDRGPARRALTPAAQPGYAARPHRLDLQSGVSPTTLAITGYSESIHQCIVAA